MTRYTLEAETWGPVLEGIEAHGKRPRALATRAGAVMESRARLRFKNESRKPSEWKERAVPNKAGIFRDFEDGSPAPKASRTRAAPVLVDTGRLQGSIKGRATSDTEAECGSNVPYAQKQHAGADGEVIGTITEEFQAWLLPWLDKQGPDIQDALGWMIDRRNIGTRVTIDIPARPIVVMDDMMRDGIARAVGARVLDPSSGGGEA